MEAGKRYSTPRRNLTFTILVNGAVRSIKFSDGQYPAPAEPDLTIPEMIRAIESHRWYGSLFFQMGDEPSGVANLSKSEHKSVMNAAREIWKKHLQEVADTVSPPLATPIYEEKLEPTQQVPLTRPTADDITKMSRLEAETFLVSAGVDFDEEEHLATMKKRIREYVKES